MHKTDTLAELFWRITAANTANGADLGSIYEHVYSS